MAPGATPSFPGAAAPGRLSIIRHPASFRRKEFHVEGNVVRVTLSLIGPGILLIFGVAFAATWSIERSRPYLLCLAAACWVFTLAALCQILHWPADTGPNALLSGALYTAAVLLTVQGLLWRAGRPARWRTGVAMLAAFVGALAYFFYVDRNLLVRIYLQNFGYGLLLLGAAWRMRHLARGRTVDRILFWVLLVFGLQFFPRTLLTIGFTAPTGARAFADSVFWQTLQLSLAVLGTALALAMLAACAADIIEDLRRDRDVDGLTGLLNRRAFQERAMACLGHPDAGSLVLCDVDHFKRINDIGGHDAGDGVLREVASVLRHASRQSDVVGRLGGEEFGVFLPSANLAEAAAFAARLQRAVAGHAYTQAPGNTRITASFGAAQAQARESWEALYRRTDALLYQAKRNGRDQVVSMAAD